MLRFCMTGIIHISPVGKVCFQRTRLAIRKEGKKHSIRQKSLFPPSRVRLFVFDKCPVNILSHFLSAVQDYHFFRAACSQHIIFLTSCCAGHKKKYSGSVHNAFWHWGNIRTPFKVISVTAVSIRARFKIIRQK